MMGKSLTCGLQS